ncbi:MAG: restriction endonuclease subunit S [Enterocloster clostridioformis]|uniref:restriction endonuclease subunit S n=1 Tax=Enterocloster clostridioformis TaxID=1531 RepID=UPI001DCD236B|nr:restriction endonuclease subunit S [Enterocloster clostridioformis]MBS7002138.1 restriction endonuclease subunit S [Enterocloster clostridioformis]
MKSNYDILGNHIRLIDTRNTDSVTDRVLGINIDKFFMPSVANVIGTDLSKYKLITKSKFACNPMHVGRDERLPVALYEEDEPAIVSPAYFMFEIIDRTLLDENYLMMWFRRPEFDRICWLHTDGSVRGGITWDDICRLELPVPAIEEQRDIVRSYMAITERIALKRQINDNLEATLDAVFCNLYQSIEDENAVSFSDLCSLASSKRVFAEDYVVEGTPFYRGKEITQKRNGEPINDPLFISNKHYETLKKNYGVPSCGDILITAVGTIGNSYLVENEEFYFKDGNIIWLKDFKKAGVNYYLYDYMQTSIFKRELEGICIGSTQTALTIVALSNLKIKVPEDFALSDYINHSQTLRSIIQQNNAEVWRLSLAAQTILASLSR